MCMLDQSDPPTASSRDLSTCVEPGSPPAWRWQMWEIEPAYHWSLISACLGPAELRRLLRQAGWELAAMPDHEVYRLAVREAGRGTLFAQLAQRHLDHGYGSMVRHVAAAQGMAALRAVWSEACATGQMAAAYWALMSHRHVPEPLRGEVFGEIHMLLHVLGDQNHKSLRRLRQLEQDLARAEDRLARARRHAAETIEAKDARIQALEQELAEACSLLARIRAPAAADGEALPGCRLHHDGSREESPLFWQAQP